MATPPRPPDSEIELARDYAEKHLRDCYIAGADDAVARVLIHALDVRAAAVALLIAHGPCDNADPDSDQASCSVEGCEYCALNAVCSGGV